MSLNTIVNDSNAMPGFAPVPRRRILLVEDSPESEAFIRHTCLMLNKDIKISCVRTGESALQLLEAKAQYDLVIADYFLGDSATGLDLWRICKERYKNIPFMITSSLSREEFQLLTQDDDGPTYLSKTLNLESTKKVLKKFLSDFTDKQNVNGIRDFSRRESHPVDVLRMLYTMLLCFNLFFVTLIFSNHFQQDQLPQISRESRAEADILSPPSKIETKKAIMPQQVPFDVSNIVTLELKQKINEIIKKDEAAKEYLDRIWVKNNDDSN